MEKLVETFFNETFGPSLTETVKTLILAAPFEELNDFMCNTLGIRVRCKQGWRVQSREELADRVFAEVKGDPEKLYLAKEYFE